MQSQSVGRPDAIVAGEFARLKAIQNPQGKSRGRGCRYRSPDTTLSPRLHGGVFLYASFDGFNDCLCSVFNTHLSDDGTDVSFHCLCAHK